MSTFISYSRANSDFAVRLASDLKAAGFDVWLDQLDIPTGARWDDEIEKALEKSNIFLIILSPESIESQNVKDEVGYAIDAGKSILPVLTRPCRIPLRLRRFQFVDFSNHPYEDSLAEIKHLLNNTKQLAAAGVSGNLEIPSASVEPKPPRENVSRVKQASAKKVAPPKTQRTWYWAFIFIGVCAVAAIGLVAIAFSLPNLQALLRAPSGIVTTVAPAIITTATPTDTPKPIPVDITITVTPSETPTATPTVRPDLCAQIADQSLKLNIAGGFQGVIGPSGIVLISKGSTNYEFTTVAAFPKEQLDSVSGTCQENTLRFTRTRPRAFIQDYQVTVSRGSNGALSLKGSLTDRSSGKRASLSGQVSAPTTPMGLCDQLSGKSVNIKHTSGFQGVLGPSGITLITQSDGTYSFSTVAAYTNEPVDQALGNCQGNILTFTRTRANVFTQDFRATISQNGGVLFLEGLMTDRQTGKQSNWSGQVTGVHP